MLKKILKAIRVQLLKVDWIKLEVEAYRNVQEKKRRHERWAKLMHSGNAGHAADKRMIVDYQDGRMVGQRHVEPVFIDSTQWGGLK